MSAAFFSDLDNTLIFSSNSKHYDSKLDLIEIEQHSNQRSFGYMSSFTLERLQKLSGEIPFIPTTTRTEEQYSRILLPEVEINYAIVANGAVVLRDGQADQAWEERVRDEILPQASPLARVQESLRSIFDSAGIERREHVVEGLFLYDYLLRPEELSRSVMLSVELLAAEARWKISIQHHKFYLIPLGLTKGVATLEVASRLGVDQILGAGDSLLDVSLLDAATHAWGLEGELDRLNPYPYQRIQEHGFAGSERLMQEVFACLPEAAFQASSR